MKRTLMRRVGIALSAFWLSSAILIAPVAALAEVASTSSVEFGDPSALGTPDVPHGAGEGAGGEHVRADAPSKYTIIATIVNFAIFAFIIVKFAGGAFNKNMAARREKLLADIEEASRLRREAEELLASYQAKLDAFDEERASLLAEFREIGSRERDRLITEAEAEAASIVEDARNLGEREELSAAKGIEMKLVDRAMELAVADLQRQVNPMLQNRLIDRSIDNFKAMKAT